MLMTRFACSADHLQRPVRHRQHLLLFRDLVSDRMAISREWEAMAPVLTRRARSTFLVECVGGLAMRLGGPDRASQRLGRYTDTTRSIPCILRQRSQQTRSRARPLQRPFRACTRPQPQGYVRVRLTKLANRDNSLFGVQMYNGECSQGDDCFAGGERAVTDSDAPPALDYQWASSLLGFVALAMAPFRTSPCKPSHVPVPWAGTADRFRQQFCSSSSARGSGAPRASRRPRRDAHALHIY